MDSIRALGLTTASTVGTRRDRSVSAPLAAAVAVCTLISSLAGCAEGMSGFINGLLNPAEVGSYGLFGREVTLDIRSSLTLQDAPTGVAGVSDPQPEDLVPLVEEYEYRIGDILAIRIYELLERGTETAVQVTIDEMGSISIPVVGRIEVAGLTLPEIRAEVVDQVVRREILVDPEIIVEPVVRRRLSYTVYGTIAQPNLYPLGQYDLRLLDAINIAGGLVESVTEIYVVRDQELPEPVMVPGSGARDWSEGHSAGGELKLSDGYVASGNRGRVSRATSGQPDTPPATVRDERVPRWIYKNGEWVELDAASAAEGTASVFDESSPSAEKTPSTTQQARTELIEAMVGESPTTTATAAPAVRHDEVPATPSQPRWIYYNGKWIETERPTSVPTEATASRQVEVPERVTQPSIDWSQVAGLSEHRVIKISASALREGDPRHNIVVRAGDTIRLASGEFGEYYVMGQIIRPGAYSLTGRMITLKTAIAAAGNLAPLAWPTHCTVYRRLGDREQMIQVNLDAIFAGREQDFFIKQDDLILVGTHPVAPFLAVLRNAFRVSYGFGFVYDRNFADIDAYGAKINPANRPNQLPNLFQ